MKVHRKAAMSTEIKKKIRINSEAGAKAGQLFSALRIQAEKEGRASIITLRDIENQRETLRREGIGPNTTIEAILADLRRDDFVLSYRLDSEGRITHLFFTYYKVIEIIKRN